MNHNATFEGDIKIYCDAYDELHDINEFYTFKGYVAMFIFLYRGACNFVLKS